MAEATGKEARDYPERIWAGHLGGGRRTWKPDLAHEDEKVFACEYVRADVVRARIEELEGALEPFARYATKNGFGLDNHGNERPDDEGVGWIYLTNRDFRRARATLTPSPAETGEDSPENSLP